MDGFLLVDKAGDMTSHDVVAIARKNLNTNNDLIIKHEFWQPASFE